MGTSFTSFKGYGFWAKDSLMCAWMSMLVAEIDTQGTLTKDQQAFRHDLMHQASLQLNGCLSDCLDHAARSQHLQEWISQIGRKALRTLRNQGEILDPTWLAALMMADGSVASECAHVPSSIPARPYLTYGHIWLALIEGNFEPLPLRPSGKYHATGQIEIDLTKVPA